MSETGFGSYSYPNNPPDEFDAGFGSPFTSGRDTGFGSTFDTSLEGTELADSVFYIGDDGGTRIDIIGNWWQYATTKRRGYANDFRVSFVKGGIETYALPAFVGHPTTRSGYVYTNLDQTRLHAWTPPLAKGVYSIKIRWPLNTITLTNAFEVITRNRSLPTYIIRSLLPSYISTTRKMETESLSSVNYNNTEALTRSLGELLQNIGGKPLTLSTLDYNEGDATLNVETTLGFPSQGHVYLEDMHLKYTGKTNTSFTGVSRVGIRRKTIKKGSKVVQYDYPY